MDEMRLPGRLHLSRIYHIEMCFEGRPVRLKIIGNRERPDSRLRLPSNPFSRFIDRILMDYDSVLVQPMLLQR